MINHTKSTPTFGLSQMNLFWQAFKPILTIVAIITFSAFGYGIFNDVYSHDSIVALSQTSDMEWKLICGRVSQLSNSFMRGYVAAPLLLAILSIIYNAGSVYVLQRMFDIKGAFYLFCISLFIVLNPALILCFTSFSHELDAFTLAQFLSLFSVYVFIRYKWGWLLSILMMAYSVGLFQAYLTSGLVLYMIYMILRLLKKESMRSVILQWMQYSACVIAAFVLYKVVLDGALAYMDLEGVSRFDLSPQSLIISVKSYALIGWYAACKPLLLLPTYHAFTLACLLGVFILYSGIIVFQIIRQRHLGALYSAFIGGIVICFPFIINLLFILTHGYTYIHIRVAYPLIFTFLLFLIYHISTSSDLTKLKLSKSFKCYQFLGVICIGLFAFSQVIYLNQMMTKRVLVSQSTDAMMNRLILSIEQLPDYKLGETPVIILGDLEDNAAISAREGFEHFRTLSLLHANTRTAALPDRPIYYTKYFQQILSYPINIKDLEFFKGNYPADIEQLPVFPNSGYCMMRDGIVYIKLAELKNK